MNMRIEGNDVRFKISQVELESLNRGDVLKQSTSLDAHQVFELNIAPKALDNGDLELHTGPSLWTLYIDTETIEDLIAAKPTRKGLSARQGSLNLTLQIDIRPSS